MKIQPGTIVKNDYIGQLKTNTSKEKMSYFGGKAQDGVYQTIINQIPPHQIYIEPFLGGGAIKL